MDPMALQTNTWVRTLRARGVSVTLRNNRLWLQPAIAHSQLSDDELLFLRHHRAAIKAVVSGGDFSEADEGHPRATISARADLTPAPPPAPSERASPEIWRIVHSNTPEAKAERDAYATRQMLRMVRYGSPYI